MILSSKQLYQRLKQHQLIYNHSKSKDLELQIQLYDELKSQIAEIKEEIIQKRYMIETYERYMYE